jgi:hypothetical protein
MTNRISVSTAKSIHPVIEVEIDGIVYNVVPFNKPLFDRMKELEAVKTTSGYEGISVVYDQLQLLTGAPKEVVERIDARDLQDVLVFITNQIYQFMPQTTKTAEEVEQEKKLTPEEQQKNGPEPGESQ